MQIGIGTRLRLYFGLVLVIVLAISASALWGMQRMAVTVGGQLVASYEASNAMDRLRLLAGQARAQLAASAAAGTVGDRALLEGPEKDFSATLSVLRRLSSEPGALDEAGRLFTQTLTLGQALVVANAEQRWAEAGALSPRFEKSAKDTDAALTAQATALQATVQRSLSNASQDLHHVAWLLGGGMLLSLAMGLWVSASIQRRLVVPLKTLTNATSRIVELGDLSQNIELPGSHDEIGQLGKSFLQMVAKLAEIPTSLRQAAQSLRGSVSDLARATEEQTEVLGHQSAAFHETQLTARSIARTSTLAVEQSGLMLQAATHATSIARSGETALEQSVRSLTGIRTRVVELGQQIRALGDHALQIGSITETLKELVDRLNILALNAAIEAAHSGASGSGFAVVAREIRSLSNQSREATDRINEVLALVGGSIHSTVKVTEEGVVEMETGLGQIRDSGENFRELAQVVKESSASTRQIAEAVNQQNAGIAQISGAVSDLTSMMTAATERLASTNRALGLVEDVAQRISQIVNDYSV